MSVDLTPDEAREVMRRHLGDEWEAILVTGNLIAGPDALAAVVEEKRKRALIRAENANPEMTDEEKRLFRDAWGVLWVDSWNRPSSRP